MGKQKLFLDGLWMDADDALRRRLSPGVLKGRGVFETMRAYHGKIFLLEEHLARLARGLRELNLKLPCSRKAITDVLCQSMKRNRIKNARLRLTVWQKGRKQHWAIDCSVYKPYSARFYHKGLRGVIVKKRLNERLRARAIKSIQYGIFLEAYQEAVKKGYDEALFLNRKGHLVEGSRTNIFFAKKGILFTPALRCGCLKGVMREKVLKLSRAKGMRSQAVEAKPKDLFEADEAFLTNSLIEIMPLTSLNCRRINKGKVGYLTQSLRMSYEEAKGFF